MAALISLIPKIGSDMEIFSFILKPAIFSIRTKILQSLAEASFDCHRCLNSTSISLSSPLLDESLRAPAVLRLLCSDFFKFANKGRTGNAAIIRGACSR